MDLKEMVVYLYNSKSVVVVCRHSFGCMFFLKVSYLSFSDLREVSDLEVRLLLFSSASIMYLPFSGCMRIALCKD